MRVFWRIIQGVLVLLAVTGLVTQLQRASREPSSIWSESKWILPIYGVAFLIFLGTSRFLVKYKEQIPWSELRFFVPFGFLALSGVISILGLLMNSSATSDTALFINAPAILLVAPILYSGQPYGPTDPSWGEIISSSIGFTVVGWYFLVRIVEWIAWRDAPPPSLKSSV